jgi:hypothetical protein
MTHGVLGGALGTFALLCALLASSCGGRTWDPAVAQGEFPLLLAEAICGGDAMDGCCTAAGFRGANPDCVRSTAAPIQERAARAVEARQRYDGRAAAACVGAWRSFFAGCPAAEATLPVPEACARVYLDGTKPEGAGCTSDWECARRTEGTAACLSEAGVCGIIASGTAGAACNEPTLHKIECSSGLRCDPNLSACVEPLALGAFCSSGVADECGPGTVCDPDVQRACVTPPRAFGEPCTSTHDCDGYACFNGRCGALTLDLTRCLD